MNTKESNTDPLSNLMDYIFKHPKFIDFYNFVKENKIELSYGKGYCREQHQQCNLNELIDNLDLRDNLLLKNKLLFGFEKREQKDQRVLSILHDVLKNLGYKEGEIMMRILINGQNLNIRKTLYDCRCSLLTAWLEKNDDNIRNSLPL
jgi:hypothetical protein